MTASAGLFALVYGFSHAETDGWGDPLTVGFLAAGGRPARRLRRDPAARPRTRCCRCASCSTATRGGSFLAFAIAGVRHVRRLPVPHLLPAADARLLARRDRPRLPADDRGADGHGDARRRRVLPRGSARGRSCPPACCSPRPAMVLLTRLGVDTDLRRRTSSPRCCALGLGMGLIFAPSMSAATPGVATQDAGVASAMVNTDAAGRRLDRHRAAEHDRRDGADLLRGRLAGPAVLAQAAVHSYTVAFWWSAGVFALGAVALVPAADAGNEAGARAARRPGHGPLADPLGAGRLPLPGRPQRSPPSAPAAGGLRRSGLSDRGCRD